MNKITLEDVLKNFMDRSPNSKVYQVGGVVIDYLISENKFYITTFHTREMTFDEVVNYFKRDYKNNEKFYKEEYKKICPFRN